MRLRRAMELGALCALGIAGYIFGAYLVAQVAFAISQFLGFVVVMVAIGAFFGAFVWFLERDSYEELPWQKNAHKEAEDAPR